MRVDLRVYPLPLQRACKCNPNSISCIVSLQPCSPPFAVDCRCEFDRTSSIRQLIDLLHIHSSSERECVCVISSPEESIVREMAMAEEAARSDASVEKWRGGVHEIPMECPLAEAWEEENVFCGGVKGYAAECKLRGTSEGQTMLEFWKFEVEPLDSMSQEGFTSFIQGFFKDVLVKGIERGAQRLAQGLEPKEPSAPAAEIATA